MSLYHRYRPTTFDEVTGNEDLIASLKGTLLQEDPPHAILFSGPTGCGKTTLSRIVASELGCKGSDFQELDSASYRGIDDIREIRKQSMYMPVEGKCRVWLLDECHKLSNDAMNALLKALEDTPLHVFYILATTDPQKLLPTIRGRCAKFNVSLLNENQLYRLLRKVCRSEEVSIEKEILEQIAQDSEGHPRNALQILEQVMSVDPEKRLAVAKKTAEKQSQTIELCRALIGGAPWKKVAGILSGLKDEDPESIRRAILGYCNSILLKGEDAQAGKVMEQMLEPLYNTGWPGLTFACYAIVCGEA